LEDLKLRSNEVTAMSGEALRDAICEGELAEAKRLIEEEGVSVNYVDADDGWPLLLWAVKENQPACLEYLIENSASARRDAEREKSDEPNAHGARGSVWSKGSHGGAGVERAAGATGIG